MSADPTTAGTRTYYDGYSWEADIDLNWSLITAIEENDEIKQGLFPSPGQDTRKGNGKPKTDHQYALAVAIFAKHPDYSEAFDVAKTPKEKALWTRRIKNRIKR